MYELELCTDNSSSITQIFNLGKFYVSLMDIVFDCHFQIFFAFTPKHRPMLHIKESVLK